MPTVTLVLHFEYLDTGEPSWWAESDDVPGFYAAGRSLAEMYSLAREALTDEHGSEPHIAWATSTSSEADAGFREQSGTALRIPA